MKTSAKLYLIPVPISEENAAAQFPEYNAEIVRNLKHFIAEDAKSARKFLKTCRYQNIDQAEIQILNEHSKEQDLAPLMKSLENGFHTGLMSDAGCPGIADPGAEIVKLAHLKKIEVIPLVGPSSIVLSIMASGFNGQNFAFNGYLPVDKNLRQKKIKELEQKARLQKQAQFFIETPYRNEQVFESLLNTLSPDALLFVGKNLLGKEQFLKTDSVSEWRKTQTTGLHKIPAVFGIFF